MTDTQIKLTRGNVRARLNLEPVAAELGTSAGVIYDPVDPQSGLVYVRVVASTGLGAPFLARGPTDANVMMVPGAGVWLQTDAEGHAYISGPNFSVQRGAGTNPIMNNMADPANRWVAQQSIITGLSHAISTPATPSTEVAVRGWKPIVNGTAYDFRGAQTTTFTANIPAAGSHRLGVIFLQSDYATLETQFSTAKDVSDDLTVEADVQECLDAASTGAVALWAWRLHDAQTSITDADLWLDLRQFLNVGDMTLAAVPILAPTTAGRNLIDATGQAGVIPLQLRHTTEQLRLEYDAANYASFTVSSGGDLTIAPTGGDTAITGTLKASGHAAFGGGAISATLVISISGTVADPAGTIEGVDAAITTTYTSNNAQNISALRGAVTINASGQTITNFQTGFLGSAIASGATGTVTNLIGARSVTQNTGAGTVIKGYGWYSSAVVNSGGGTFTGFAGVAVTTSTGVATNTTDVLVNTGAPPTIPVGDWSLYINTSKDGVLLGKLSIGKVTAPGSTLDLLTSDAATNAVTNVLIVGHDSSGTPAAGYGTGLVIRGKSSTTAGQSMADIAATWVVATHASRTARLSFYAYDTAARTCLQIEASGTAAMIGFLGTAPIVKTGAFTQTYSTSSHTTANPTATAVSTTAATQTTPWGYGSQAQADDIITQLNKLITDMANAKNNITAIIDDMQAYGLLA
jgi:hypothetical protein